jgi:hypothetical protein
VRSIESEKFSSLKVDAAWAVDPILSSLDLYDLVKTQFLTPANSIFDDTFSDRIFETFL